MNKRLFALLTAVITFTVGVVIAGLSLPQLLRKPKPPIKKELQFNNYRLSGPYQFENLSMFLIHGPDEPGSRVYMPLHDQLQRPIVVVHETNTVNELAIENVSPSEEVFIQAGDIVKGGKQDRVLAVDLILPAKSGKIPISAFCVEPSRWQPRNYEVGDHFTLTEMSANFSLRRAIKDTASQVGVWNEVEARQEKMSNSLSDEVRSVEYPSSLPLALESEPVQKSVEPYVSHLSSIVEQSNDVRGVVLTINNELIGGDVYASNVMFMRLWPRLLKAAAIEAVTELPMKLDTEGVTIEAIRSFLVHSEQGAETIEEITARTHVVKREIENSLFFETRDMDNAGAWIHRSYLTKKQ
jgi:hypothetical protein